MIMINECRIKMGKMRVKDVIILIKRGRGTLVIIVSMSPGELWAPPPLRLCNLYPNRIRVL